MPNQNLMILPNQYGQLSNNPQIDPQVLMLLQQALNKPNILERVILSIPGLGPAYQNYKHKLEQQQSQQQHQSQIVQVQNQFALAQAQLNLLNTLASIQNFPLVFQATQQAIIDNEQFRQKEHEKRMAEIQGQVQMQQTANATGVPIATQIKISEVRKRMQEAYIDRYMATTMTIAEIDKILKEEENRIFNDPSISMLQKGEQTKEARQIAEQFKLDITGNTKQGGKKQII